MRSALLLIFLILSGCQSVIDKNQTLAGLKSKSVNTIQYSQEDDLWQVIANRQGIKSVSNSRVQSRIDWISNHPEYLSLISKRAEPFLYLVVSELEKQNVPIEIALLPIVESDYYPFSYSHGTAAGLWQFIPSTGRMYGLEEDWWHADRRDVLASTKAAANYLNDLNKMFKGDWLLSIAAYNAGPGKIQRAIDTNIKLGKKTDFWSLDLPQETEKYVPKLLALSQVIKNPYRYNQKLLEIDNKPFLNEVELDSQFDLALISQWTGLSIDQIYNYNPGLKRWATPESLPYIMLLPEEVIYSFNDNLSKQDQRPKISWTRYKIKQGDSLSLIAQNYNTTIGQIMSVNELDNDAIRADKYLIVPLAQKSENYYSLSDNQREKSRLNIQKNSEKIIYTVVAGDSLWKISIKFDTTINNLVRWNQISPSDSLSIGKELVILRDNKNKTELAKITNTGIDINRDIFYTVKEGDNLSRIAQKYNVKIAEIRSWNDLNEEYILQPGDKLTITINVVNSNLS
ncbi:LysM peptidoglycan-binding domain-containing protein [Candidatus Thioglobus sp.]|nr:LysM peptidoglycan-binding domain-containing protein [Candidatus Thioglobus sp.]MDA8981118.1 LysM peptidoglycan-binding domain-containing protein [Candidatus Thioglobus sp.]